MWGFCTKEQRTNYEWRCSLSVFIQFFPDVNPRKHCEFQSSDQAVTMWASVDWRGLSVPYLNPTAALQGPWTRTDFMPWAASAPAQALSTSLLASLPRKFLYAKQKALTLSRVCGSAPKQQPISKTISLCILPRFSLCNGNRSFLKSKMYSSKQTTMTKCGSQGSMRVLIGVSAFLYTLFTSL